MPNAYFTIAKPANDPFKSYLPGSPERAELKAELARQSAQVVKIPLIIGGKEVWTDKTIQVTIPHDHQHVIAECCMAGEKELKMAVDAALAAKDAWEEMPWEHRSAIFLKAADLITGSYRQVLNASTMLGQSKTVFQAEIDIAELADFLRFGVWSAQEIFKDQPLSVDRDLEPPGLPPPGWLYLRHLSLQLHLHRRKPAHRPRHRGQCLRLEALPHRRAVQLLLHEAADVVRPARRRHQFRPLCRL